MAADFHRPIFKKLKKLSTVAEWVSEWADAPANYMPRKLPSHKTSHFTSDQFDFLQLIQRWEEIVGPQLAAHTGPLRIKNQTLIILTRHSEYAHHLNFLSEDMKSKIFGIYPHLKHHFKKIYFKSSPQHFAELERQRAEVKVQEQEGKRKHHPFSPQYRKIKLEAEKKFADIQDTELRASLIRIEIQKNLDQ